LHGLTTLSGQGAFSRQPEVERFVVLQSRDGCGSLFNLALESRPSGNGPKVAGRQRAPISVVRARSAPSQKLPFFESRPDGSFAPQYWTLDLVCKMSNSSRAAHHTEDLLSGTKLRGHLWKPDLCEQYPDVACGFPGPFAQRKPISTHGLVRLKPNHNARL